MKKIYIFLFMVVNILVFSHPHVFMENFLRVDIENNNLIGVNIDWRFNSLYSNLLIKKFDLDKNNSFDKNEKDEVIKYFDKQYGDKNYFTFIYINEKKINCTINVKNVKIIDNRYIDFSYIVTIQEVKLFSGMKILISVYDDSYYNYINTKKIQNFEIITKNNKFVVDKKIIASYEKSYYYDQVFPYEYLILIK